MQKMEIHTLFFAGVDGVGNGKIDKADIYDIGGRYRASLKPPMVESSA